MIISNFNSLAEFLATYKKYDLGVRGPVLCITDSYRDYDKDYRSKTNSNIAASFEVDEQVRCVYQSPTLYASLNEEDLIYKVRDGVYLNQNGYASPILIEKFGYGESDEQLQAKAIKKLAQYRKIVDTLKQAEEKYDRVIVCSSLKV